MGEINVLYSIRKITNMIYAIKEINATVVQIPKFFNIFLKTVIKYKIEASSY